MNYDILTDYKISVLCVMEKSNYYKIPGLDLWDETRNAYNYKGTNEIIAHPPCAQWSRLKGLAKPDPYTKELGPYCIELVKKNGGIVEHPNGSDLFKKCGITKGIIKVRQSWWGYPAIKETLLWFNQVKPLSYPITLDQRGKSIEKMDKKTRSLMTLEMCQWLVDNIIQERLRREVIQKEYGF